MYSERPEVMIAIAPDPAHTHAALLFDRLIDTFQDALQDSGWDYQGSWMPWQVAASGKADSSSVEEREENRLFQTGREAYPGVILFRPSDRGDATRPPLVVVVAADSPTGGIVKSQFREALQIFLTLSAPGEKLRILGPDYTGAGPSLRALLNESKDLDANTPLTKARAVSVASGSVSDWHCEHFLPDIEAKVPGQSDCGDSSAKFLSFGVDSQWELQQIWSFLRLHGHLYMQDIAELSEDESGFGGLLLLGKSGKDTSGILHLKFPRGISHLRTAYQKNSIWGFGGSSSGASSVSLSMDFEEPQLADDSVPIYAQQQMPVSQESSMGQVASILEENRIKAVLVSASDVLDEIFVAQILARQAPNVMVILRGTDVLFLRASDSSVYRNMYAVGPWPLIPRNAIWSMPANSEPLTRTFSSGDSEGVYAATRYLIDERIDQLQDYRPPLYENLLKEAGTASHVETRPPLWFSAIRHGAFWPIALLNDTISDQTVKRSEINLPKLPQQMGAPSPRGQEAALSQRLLLLLAFALSFLHVGKCLDLPLLERIAPRYRIYDEATRRPKLVLQLAISLLGVVMLCVVHEPPVNWSFADTAWHAMFLIAMALLSLAAAHVSWLLWRARPSSIAGQSAAGDRMTVSLLTGLFFILGYLLWMGIWHWLPGSMESEDGMGKFFDFRARFPLSGASPVFPLLLALNAITLILFSHLARLTFTPAMTPRVPGDVPAILNCPGQRATEPISSLLAWPIPGDSFSAKMRSVRPKILMLGGVMLAMLVVTISTGLRPMMFESRAMQILFPATVFLVVLSILWDLTMAAVLWNRLRAGCLIPLESSPLRRGFDFVSGLTWRSLWLMPQSNDVQYRALMRSLEQAMRDVMSCWTDEKIGEASLREAVHQMWQDVADGHRSAAVAEFGSVQDKMAAIAQQLLLRLEALWAEEVDLVTAPDRTDKAGMELVESSSATERLKQIAEEWVALTYIHYIRLVLVQIRSRLATAAIAYILLIWSITVYPFINRHVLMIGLSGLLGILTFVVISTYASINRDPILSRTTNERPGKLDLDFYLRTASMVGIPFLGLVASQFPEVSSFLFSWIEPGMAAVK